MVFYLAKGEPDACGQGCGEWIAAEGEFDPGAPQRLRSLLTRLGKRKLPIFFNSPGGLRQEAMSIGRMLRERQMTAGVSETIPADCAAPAAPACQALKRSGQELASELRNVSGLQFRMRLCADRRQGAAGAAGCPSRSPYRQGRARAP